MWLLIHLYDDDTIQVSILYECSLLIELSTNHWSSYLLSDLYVGSVDHMTHANSIRSDYLRMINLLVRHWDHFKKMINSFYLVINHCLVSFNSDLLIHSMSHRTWIAILMSFASLFSCFFNCLIDCLTD